jgi:hypothetical protein
MAENRLALSWRKMGIGASLDILRVERLAADHSANTGFWEKRAEIPDLNSKGLFLLSSRRLTARSINLT